MTVSFLEWDSNFFNRAVAKIDIDGNEEVDIEQVINDCKMQGYKLIYIFVDSRNTVMKGKAVLLLGTSINEKLVLEKKVNFIQETDIVNLNDKYSVTSAGVINTGQDFYNKVLELTIKAGNFSRFKLDEKLDSHYFLEMYRIWVDALINDKSYRITVANSNEGKVIGFLSYKTIREGYKIDFMSIDDDYKKMGIGKALLQKAFEEITKGELKYVVTEIHAANTSAYNFFISHGFTAKAAFEIYHVHL